MKISELILELIKSIENYGDIEIETIDCHGCSTDIIEMNYMESCLGDGHVLCVEGVHSIGEFDDGR
jgi:hypothetical protein